VSSKQLDVTKITDLSRARLTVGARQMQAMKRDLKETLGQVQSAMELVLDVDFLTQPMDEAEGIILRKIRNHYIPECVLAYNNVLYFAGHAISRQYMVECMDLAQMVAQSGTLTNAFVESGRMRELVTAFALDSQALLQANEQAAGGKTKKGKKDKGLEIWQVSWKEQSRPTDLETLD